ncbi:MAG: radical SAM family heme chaperone HemW [Candidatus Omnitrophota bacterium]
MKPCGLYVHIPFCVKKCAYCDFNSLVPSCENQVNSYIKALFADIKISGFSKEKHIIKSIYFGGGTPSLIKAEYIAQILYEIGNNFDVSSINEVTIEVNPESISRRKLAIYKSGGINRISMGVQSFNDRNLKLLGRAHTARDVFNAIDLIKNAGFNKTSIDLIYGIPGQTLKDWEKDLYRFLKTEIPHISCYDLKIEKNTFFYLIRDKLDVADNDLQAEMYKLGCRKLERAGFLHYEISSFALKGQESLHNSIYWRNEEYIGLGAGAYSYLKGRRFAKPQSLPKYQHQILSGSIKKYKQEKLGDRERLTETIILNLRLLRGFSLRDIEERTGVKVDRCLTAKLDGFVKQKFILSSRGSYRLSKRGMLFYDTIASELL